MKFKKLLSAVAVASALVSGAATAAPITIDVAAAGLATPVGTDGKTALLNIGMNWTAKSDYTDANGNYLFKDLPAATYYVQVLSSSVPTGLSQTTTYPNNGADLFNQNQSSGNGYQVTLSAGQENLTADFGFNWNPTTDVTTGGAANATAALGDRVWIDMNGNGYQDPFEVGVRGATVTRTWRNATPTPAAAIAVETAATVGLKKPSGKCMIRNRRRSSRRTAWRIDPLPRRSQSRSGPTLTHIAVIRWDRARRLCRLDKSRTRCRQSSISPDQESPNPLARPAAL